MLYESVILQKVYLHGCDFQQTTETIASIKKTILHYWTFRFAVCTEFCFMGLRGRIVEDDFDNFTKWKRFVTCDKNLDFAPFLGENE